MKKVIYLFTALSLIFVSCSKDNSSDVGVASYNPYELNEIQENAINVVSQYATDNINALRNGNVHKSDFYDNLRDTLALYLHEATAALNWIGIKGGVPLDVCMDVLTSQRDSFANINVMNDTAGGVFKAVTYYEQEFSDAYHSLREKHMDLRHQGFDAGIDLLQSNLLSEGLNTLPVEESNYLASRINPILGVHSMFESGEWDRLKDLYGNNGNDKFFSCIAAACVAIAASEAAAGAATAATVFGGVAGGTAAITTIVKNTSKSWGLPSDVTNWQHNHINAVFGSCASLLDLVENHLDTE